MISATVGMPWSHVSVRLKGRPSFLPGLGLNTQADTKGDGFVLGAELNFGFVLVGVSVGFFALGTPNYGFGFLVLFARNDMRLMMPPLLGFRSLGVGPFKKLLGTSLP